MLQRQVQVLFLFIISLLQAPAVMAQSIDQNEASALPDALKTYPYTIIFETYRDNNWELFSMNADGSNLVNLTNTPDIHEMYPQVSPDGTRIAFVSDETIAGRLVRSIYYMNADGSGRTKVGENVRQPCWSPDGKTIAYLKGKYEKFNVTDYTTKGLYFYDLETGEHRKHPLDSIEHLYNICWSKNGRWIVATVHAGMGFSHAILAIDVNSDRIVDLKIGGCRPDLSPDGSRIVWGRTDNEIAIGDIDFDSDEPAVTNHFDVVSDELHVYHADWSPDGQYITFSRGPGGDQQPCGPGTNRGVAEFVGVYGKWDICIVSAEPDSRPIQLTHDGLSNKESEWQFQSKSTGNAR